MKLPIRTCAAAVAAAIAAACAPQAHAQAAGCALPPGNAAQRWDAIATSTVLAAGPFQNEGLVYMAYVNGAAYDALVSATGRHEPLGPRIRVLAPASGDAAVASAAFEVLAEYFPAQADALRCYRELALAEIPDGSAKTSGIAVGRAAAANMIAARSGDGRLPIGTIMPDYPVAGPGVWQPTPPAFAAPQTPWMSSMRPFLLRSARQFLPGPPLRLHSRRWAREVNEVHAWGRATGGPRTPEQTDIARFWSTNVIAQYNTAFRDVATQHGFDLLDSERLIAAGSVVAADAQIACMTAKYAYWFWRPVTAISATGPAVEDGNPGTLEEPGWTPLLTTPNHPEYPAAHGCLTAAMAELFTVALGTEAIDLTLTSTVVPTMPARHYATAEALRGEIVEARLWGGLHYRSSSRAGVRLGHRVARYDLEHAFYRARGRDR